MFDPGNGTREYTKGKRSPDESLFEGEWAREMVDRIIKAFEGLEVECINIVPEREDIPRSERIKRANTIIKNNPDKKCYYISVHINAAGNEGKWLGARGFCVYVAKNASQESHTLAQNIYTAAEELGLKGNRCVPGERYWQANFDVIYFTKCPAILTENLFMDNKEDLEILKSEEGKEKIVNLHLIGICKTLGLPCSTLII